MDITKCRIFAIYKYISFNDYTYINDYIRINCNRLGWIAFDCKGRNALNATRLIVHCLKY